MKMLSCFQALSFSAWSTGYKMCTWRKCGTEEGDLEMPADGFPKEDEDDVDFKRANHCAM